MLEPADLQKIDELEASIQDLLRETIDHYSALSQPEKETVDKIIRRLDKSWDRLLAEAGESDAAVPQRSIRALVACGCVMSCMAVVQADDKITLDERELLLHLTDRLAGPLSLDGMSPVSGETVAGSIEFYTHLVDSYDVMDHRVAGTLCAAIDVFRGSELMPKYAKRLTLLGRQISFVDGDAANVREQAVLRELEDTMQRVNDLIKDAGL